MKSTFSLFATRHMLSKEWCVMVATSSCDESIFYKENSFSMHQRIVRISTIALSLVLIIAGIAYFADSPLQDSSSKGVHKTHKKQHPTPTPTPQQQHPTPAPTQQGNGPFQLIFSDDFSSPQLNSQWITYNGPHGGGDSCYDPHELQLQNGLLHILMEQKANACGLPYVTGGIWVRCV